MSELDRLRAVVEFVAQDRGRMAAHVHYDEARKMAKAALAVDEPEQFSEQNLLWEEA